MGKRFTVFSYEIDRLVHAERGKKKKKRYFGSYYSHKIQKQYELNTWIIVFMLQKCKYTIVNIIHFWIFVFLNKYYINISFLCHFFSNLIFYIEYVLNPSCSIKHKKMVVYFLDMILDQLSFIVAEYIEVLDLLLNANPTWCENQMRNASS